MARLNSRHTFSVALMRKHFAKVPGGLEAIARMTKINLRVVRAHRDGDMHVKDFHLIAYMRALPVAFTNDVLREAGMGGARKLAAVCPRKVLAKITGTSAVLADALQDNRIDHIERPKVNEHLIDLGFIIADEGRIAA